jgi:hypothetical protein
LHFKSDLVAIRHSGSIASRFRSDGRLAGHALFDVVLKIGVANQEISRCGAATARSNATAVSRGRAAIVSVL